MIRLTLLISVFPALSIAAAAHQVAVKASIDSGYGSAGFMPGNVLLAFSVDGK